MAARNNVDTDQRDSSSTERELTITRFFDAPRALVWQCFTESEHMNQWFGPKGSVIIASKMDFRVGGTYHGAMRDPEGRVTWAKFIYRQIVASELLVWEHTFSDEAGGLTRHPLSPTWPLKLLATVTFEDARGRRGSKDSKTKLTLRWVPLEATEEELRTFDAAQEGMRGGWAGAFEQLDAYLARAA
jgi:uncharacterized protein YndB with AHSA1/START domain